MSKILPIVLALFGLAGGLGAGMALRPEMAQSTGEPGECAQSETALDPAGDADDAQPASKEPEARDFVKLNNQFVVPVVHDGKVSALVVMSLSLELSSGGPELVYKMEPKIRDALLQVLFDHANIGGFDAEFTNGRNMKQLRRSLLDVARKVLGPTVES
ncbi:MAG TPA: flagellar basal body-associated FliL family protein, partial [Rhodobacteraceae bacterium]|nr:flagellar basal body-associated FliL family protein [Paracoccaceae bacterium]